LRTQVVVEADCPLLGVGSQVVRCSARYRTTFTLYRGSRDVHVKLELLGRRSATGVGTAYGFFPLYGEQPWIAVHRPGDLCVPPEDLGGRPTTAGLAVHRGVRVECEHAGMNYYPLDTPLIGFGGPANSPFDPAQTFKNSVLYATLIGAGGTAFASASSPNPSLKGRGVRSFASSSCGPGCLASKPAWDFILRPTGNDEWDGALARGGLEVFRPIVGTVVKTISAQPARSLVRIEPDLVHLLAIRPAEGGLVVRLWSADPDPLKADIRLPIAKRGDILYVCDSHELPFGKRIDIHKQGLASVPMKPHETLTLMLKTKI
jgi:hypothetical protein